MSFLKQKSFSRGVNINFKNDKDSKDFCDSFEEWRKDALVQGATLHLFFFILYQFTSRSYSMEALCSSSSGFYLRKILKPIIE